MTPSVPSQGMEERFSNVQSERAVIHPTLLQNLRCRTRNGMELRKYLGDKTGQREEGKKVPRILFALQGPGFREVDSV